MSHILTKQTSWCISIVCVCVFMALINPWSVAYSDTQMYHMNHMNHMYLITFEKNESVSSWDLQNSVCAILLHAEKGYLWQLELCFPQQTKTLGTHQQLISIIDFSYMGVSENSVPLKPMVNDHYPYEMAIIGIYPIFRQTHMHTMHSHRILISLSIPSPNGVPRPSCLALGALKLQHNPQVPSCQSPVHVPQLRGLCQIDSTLVAQKKTSRHSTKLSMVCIGVPIHYVIMCSTFRAV